VIGAGYVGLVTAVCLAELGHSVTCLEIDGERLARLRRGELPIYEPGLADRFDRQRARGRLSFTADYACAIPPADVVFLAVNTPPMEDGEADLRFVYTAVLSTLRFARPGLVLVTKSTVPVGTGDMIAELARACGPGGVHVVSNPEFLREGSAVRDFMRPDRIVIGAEDERAGELVAGLYAGIDAPVILCGRRSAEIAKYAANVFLAARISLINEVAAICEASGADIGDVARIVGADARIGPSFLHAGLGWGGSCFPKDARALAATAAEYGLPAPLLDATLAANARQRQRAVAHLLGAVDGIAEASVGILGLAFKPGTDDIREAPALDIARQLLECGIAVRAHDPVAMPNARRVVPAIALCEDPYEAARGCDALLLATEWDDYRALDWERVRGLMRGTVVVDGRNALDGAHLTALGLTHISFGRPSRVPGASVARSLQEAGAAR
jgi:UDPglucose 6-dehydrogenase